MNLFLDLETTGFNPCLNDIIEIAIVGDGLEFHEYVRPLRLDRYAIEKSSEVHGISYDKMMSFERPDLICDKLLSFLRQTKLEKLWCHALRSFDWLFLENMFRWQERHFDLYRFATIDKVESTITLAKQRDIHRQLPNYKLDTICNSIGHKFNHHSALEDAYACKAVYKHFKENL